MLHVPFCTPSRFSSIIIFRASFKASFIKQCKCKYGWLFQANYIKVNIRERFISYFTHFTKINHNLPKLSSSHRTFSTYFLKPCVWDFFYLIWIWHHSALLFDIFLSCKKVSLERSFHQEKKCMFKRSKTICLK